MLIGNEVYLGVNRLKSQQVSYTVLRLQIGTNCIVDLEKILVQLVELLHKNKNSVVISEW
jgi:hypothetical protein